MGYHRRHTESLHFSTTFSLESIVFLSNNYLQMIMLGPLYFATFTSFPIAKILFVLMLNYSKMYPYHHISVSQQTQGDSTNTDELPRAGKLPKDVAVATGVSGSRCSPPPWKGHSESACTCTPGLEQKYRERVIFDSPKNSAWTHKKGWFSVWTEDIGLFSRDRTGLRHKQKGFYVFTEHILCIKKYIF